MSWQPFGYKGEPETCVWCGRKLSRKRIWASEADAGDPSYRSDGPAYTTKLAAKSGPYQDGLFDTMSCGYLFGQRLAELGNRLQHKA